MIQKIQAFFLRLYLRRLVRRLFGLPQYEIILANLNAADLKQLQELHGLFKDAYKAAVEGLEAHKRYLSSKKRT